MKRKFSNRMGLVVLIVIFHLALGIGVAYAQSIPSQMVEMTLQAQFSNIKPESLNRVFRQWQIAEYGVVRNSFDQIELQSVAQSFTLWLLFNNPFTDADYITPSNTPQPQQQRQQTQVQPNGRDVNAD